MSLLVRIEERLDVISANQHALARERAVLQDAARQLRMGENEQVIEARVNSALGGAECKR